MASVWMEKPCEPGDGSGQLKWAVIPPAVWSNGMLLPPATSGGVPVSRSNTTVCGFAAKFATYPSSRSPARFGSKYLEYRETVLPLGCQVVLRSTSSFISSN